MNYHTILITGGEGYIARNLKPLFEQAGYNVIAPSHSELDLLDRTSIIDYLRKYRFSAIIHTASKGGKRNKTDTFEDTYLPNIQMFENLTSAADGHNIPVIIFGSGAEFDRRTNIKQCKETDIFNRCPIDPYGLSKNIITRISIDKRIPYVYILRLFGCFNHDEEDARFIKSAIRNVKEGLLIEVHQDREMDFFYLDDVYNVIEYILKNGGPKHINLVYDRPINLIGISSYINKYFKKSNVRVNKLGLAPSYSGNGDILSHLPIKLIGLEEGIRRTCEKLI
jgi:GDP-L-fucose synthase